MAIKITRLYLNTHQSFDKKMYCAVYTTLALLLTCTNADIANKEKNQGYLENKDNIFIPETRPIVSRNLAADITVQKYLTDASRNIQKRREVDMSFEYLEKLDYNKHYDKKYQTKFELPKITLMNSSEEPSSNYQQSTRELSFKRLSLDNPTTVLPTLTTLRETRSYDFIPVNIIKNDHNDRSVTHNDDDSIEDSTDSSLIPAGSSTRVQIKKGPNGKDYEYEYVYYYYDEDNDEITSTSDSAKDPLLHTSTGPRRGNSNNNKNMYSIFERTTTEPIINEVLPKDNISNSRNRQLGSSNDVSDIKLTNSRFPPRSISTINTGSTESSNIRGNRLKAGLDLVDSSSFRTYQEGPEFPSNLPNGPIRFLGVTPHEYEKFGNMKNGNKQVVEDEVPMNSKNTNTDEYHGSDTLQRQKSHYTASKKYHDKDVRLQITNMSVHTMELTNDTKLELDKEKPVIFYTNITDNRINLIPSAMNKIALDLYAFLQQGHNNFIETTDNLESTRENITNGNHLNTTEISTSMSTLDETTLIDLDLMAIGLKDKMLTSSTDSTTASMISTESSTVNTALSHNKELINIANKPTVQQRLRQPGGADNIISRNFYKSNEHGINATSENIQNNKTLSKSRNRIGGTFNSFKRPRPTLQKNTVDEMSVVDHIKNSFNSVNNMYPNRIRTNTSHSNSNASTILSFQNQKQGINGSSIGSTSVIRSNFHNLQMRRRNGRPNSTYRTTTLVAEKETTETSTPLIQSTFEVDVERRNEMSSKPMFGHVKSRLQLVSAKPIIRSSGRLNLKNRLNASSIFTTETMPITESLITERSTYESEAEGNNMKEEREVSMETRIMAKLTTLSPLIKLRSRKRLQMPPKLSTTFRPQIVSTTKRSLLLSRRKTSEDISVHEIKFEISNRDEEQGHTIETTSTGNPLIQTNNTSVTKSQEVKGTNILLLSRRKITSRRPGQLPHN